MANFLSDPRDEYWAAQEDDDSLVQSLWSRVQDFYNRIPDNIFYRRGLESYRTYYGFPTVRDPFDASELAMAGEGGEQAAIKVNHFHSIGKALITLTTNQRPSLDCVASNADTESLQDTTLATSLLDYYMREKNLEIALKQAVESAVVMGTGYLLQIWDPGAGEVIAMDPDTQSPMYEGDVVIKALTPFDVVRDLDWRSSTEHNWVITRSFESKWDVASQYPECVDEILHADKDTDVTAQWPSYWSGGGLAEYRHNRDQIPVFTFYHRKTRAMPEGAMVVFVNGKCLLYRGKLVYGQHLPIHQINASRQIGTTNGYTSLWNLLALQKGIDAAFSTALTNLSLFGVGTLIVPKGSGFNVSDLGGGAKAIEYDAVGGSGKPESLEVPMTAESVFKVGDWLIQAAQTISGVNAVVRGNASPELSGAAQALQQQMAIQYTSDLQQEWTKLLESTGTGLVKILQNFATTPRQALIVGKSKAWMLKEWTGKDIGRVARVVVQSGNAMSKTPGGKLQIAQDLIQRGLVNAKEYLQIVETGSLDSMTDGPESQLIYIKRENEMLRVGQNPSALEGDDHPVHIQEHYTILGTPEARQNEMIVKAVLGHIQEHKNLMNPPLPPPGPPGVPGAGPPPPAPPGIGPAQPGALPKLPGPPINPLTKQPWNPATGG